MAKENYTAIEMTERECKIAQLTRRKEGLFIENLLHITFPVQDENPESASSHKAKAKRASTLQQAFKQARLKPGKVTLLVPKNLVTTRLVQLPSTDPDEVTKMDRFEAGRHIQFNIERHMLSHHILEVDELKGSTVLIAAADSSVFQDMIDVINDAGLKLTTVEVSTLGLYNYYLFIRRQSSQIVSSAVSEPTSDKFSTALINIGSLTTDIVITQDGKMLFNRSCSVGVAKLREELQSYLPAEYPVSSLPLSEFDILHLQQSLENLLGISSTASPDNTETKLTEETGEASTLRVEFPSNKVINIKSMVDIVQQWLQRLLLEIRRTYEFARREFDCYPAREIFLSGEGALFKNIEQFFLVNLGVKTYFLNPIKDLPLTKPELSITVTYPQIYVECLGSLLRQFTPEAIKINLIPEIYVKRELAQQRRTSYLTQGTLIFAIIILSVIYLYQQITYRERLLNWYLEQNKKLSPAVTELTDKGKKLAIIQKHLRDKRSALAILDAISQFEFIPQRVSLTNFQYEKDASVQLNGHALSIPDLNLFESSLDKTGFFTSVTTKQRSTTTLPGRSQEIYAFTIVCELKK
ncbi:MAG: pilus assembly protein PilM [Candidatus Sumerlaeia bacterium]|nr:pilus assembly protein PilM [Candidatus Sumerlaeia bacterium]